MFRCKMCNKIIWFWQDTLRFIDGSGYNKYGGDGYCHKGCEVIRFR